MPDDIVVGLHVWPTTSLKALAEVLNRDDLAELNPLKFYVVRREVVGGTPDEPTRRIVVRSGRVAVNLERRQQRAEHGGAMPSRQSPGLNPYAIMPTPDPVPMPTQPYQAPQRTPSKEPFTADNIEDQLNAVLAQDPQWTMLHHQFAYLQMQLAQLGSNRGRDNSAAAAGLQRQIAQLQTQIAQYRERVKEQVIRGGQAPPKAALRYDGRTFEQWRMDWGNKNKELESLKALEAFAAAGYGQEAAGAILYGIYSTQDIAQHVRKFLSRLSAEEVPPILANLRDVLQNDLSVKRRIAAIRAIAAIGPEAESALDILKQRLASDDPQERIAAAAAIKMIVGKDQYQKPIADVLGEELGITVVQTDSGAWGALPRDDAADSGEAFGKFNDAVIQEQESLFPPDVKRPSEKEPHQSRRD